MNGIQPYPPSFLDTQKGSEKCFFEGRCLPFYGEPPWALLLSSLKEVSKKGATVSTRWTPTREQSPLDPARHKTCSWRPTGFCPAHLAGRGCRSYRSGKNEVYRANGLQRENVTLPQAEKTFHPACKVRPGADGGEMACRLSMAGVLGVRPPSRRPPVRKGGAFLGSSFGDERRITSRQAAGNLPTEGGTGRMPFTPTAEKGKPF